MQHHDRARESSRNLHGSGRAEDFTNPFLVSFCAVVFVIFYVIAAVFGWAFVFLGFWLSDQGLKHLLRRKIATRTVLER